MRQIPLSIEGLDSRQLSVLSVDTSPRLAGFVYQPEACHPARNKETLAY